MTTLRILIVAGLLLAAVIIAIVATRNTPDFPNDDGETM